jgi:two-component system KDP operon response regulator KdpE
MKGETGQALASGVRGATLLLVEDDEDTRFALARTLVGAGYLVLAAPTGHDAVGIVQSETGPLDVVLLDVGLPDVSGVDLCARLRELCPSLPVVVCSGEAGTPEVVRLLGLGARWHLRKPFAPEELLAAVRAALGPGAPGAPVGRGRTVPWPSRGPVGERLSQRRPLLTR